VPTAAPVQAALPSIGEIWLVYTSSAPLQVIGAVTGRSYEFSAVRSGALVDARDAAVLLRGGLFRPS